MAKRKTPLLAYCEYVSPHPNNSIQVNRARLHLIDAVRRVYPRFLKRLSSDVYQFYPQLVSQGYDFDEILWSPRISPYDALPSDSALKEALAKWAVAFNADVDWLKDAALRTLRGWYVAPDWRESLMWYSSYPHQSAQSTGEAFELRCEGWETELLTWLTYSKSVRERFEERLLQYEKSTRTLAESCGLVRARRTYSPDNLDWFVLYQFAGLPSTAIVDKWARRKPDGVDESTVLKGIKTAARLLAWDRLRAPRPRGPNRKSR